MVFVWISKEESEVEREMVEVGEGRKHEGWLKQGRCAWLIKVDFWR